MAWVSTRAAPGHSTRPLRNSTVRPRRTCASAHQANGAVVLAAVTMLALWGQLISRKTPVPNATAPNTTLPA